MTCERRTEIQAVLTPIYASSDESDGEPMRLKRYLVKKLPWERSSLRKIKEKLDNKYLEDLPMRSQRSILPRRKHTHPSTTPVPHNAPDWAVRASSPNTSGASLSVGPLATSTPNRSRIN
jgi:hypothetical protein